MAFSILKAVAIASLALTGIVSQAASTPEQVAARLYSRTQIKADSIAPSPISGLWEVVYNRKVYYTDENAKYFVMGHIFDTATQENLTAKRVDAVSRIPFAKLPFQDAIKITHGKGERKIAVFTDVKCRFCSMLEATLSKAGNITVYNFLYPVLNSEGLARDVLCAKNPAKAFENHMLYGQNPERAPGKCDSSALDRNIRLGSEFGFTGTPTIIFPDGTYASGALTLDQLEDALSTHSR